MPRGENPNSRANLDKGKRFSEETARKAAKKSQEVQAQNKDIANLVLEKMDANKLSDVIISRARGGNIKFMELLLKLVGQMPADKVDATIAAANPLSAMSPEELKEIYYGGKE